MVAGPRRLSRRNKLEATDPENLKHYIKLNKQLLCFQEVADAQEKIMQERKAKEAAAIEAARLARREARAKRIETHFLDVCPALMTPHAQKHIRKVSDALEPHGKDFDPVKFSDWETRN